VNLPLTGQLRDDLWEIAFPGTPLDERSSFGDTYAVADSAERAESAFAALEEAIERRGDTDAYPFHVMGSQGLLWLQESLTSQEEKITLLTRLRWIANEGLRLHASDPVLRQLQRDLETAYLSVATMQAEGF
jgi:hypothetical protein